MTIEPSSQQTVSLTVEQALFQALTLHKQGQLQNAEHLYRTILQVQPNHPDVNHSLGILTMQLGQPAAALPYFKAALEANQNQGQFWLSYINALIQASLTDEAGRVLQQGLQRGLNGEAVEALAARLKGMAEVTETSSAENQYELPSSSSPGTENSRKEFTAKSAKLTSSAGKPLLRKGRNPSPKETNKLLARFANGQYKEAGTLARDMTERFPRYGLGWGVLGAVFKQMGRNPDALAPMQKAAALSPGDANLHSNLAALLQDLGRFGDAEASCKRALMLRPNFAEAHFNLGNILSELQRPDEAEASYRRALQINPDFAAAHSNLGSLLNKLGRQHEAEASCRRALQIMPNFAEAYCNLGHILQELGQLEDAVVSYRRAIAFKPDFTKAYSNLLFCLSHNEDLDAQSLFAEHCNFGERFEAPMRATWPQYRNLRNVDRCLQIGFVSGDFYNHAVANFIEPVLEHLVGHPKLSLHAYYNNTIEDDVTQRLRQKFAHWNSVVRLSDEMLAKKVQEDCIDILIDLSGHTAHNRLLTFARKPAPIQASWIGYPGTTGLSAMDYYLSDRFFTPQGKFDNQFTEKIVCLPAGNPFLPNKNAPPVNGLPALSNGYVTFGSFNRLSKLCPSVIALWSQLLRALPDSRLVLGGMPEDGKYEILIEWFAQEGIVRERLDFHPRQDMVCYLNLHQQVDICLDTFPYNGGTTTLHALWMGVPTLTLAGSTPAGRAGASILCNVGLDAFVAHDVLDFVQKGLSWAGNLSSLSDIRAGLRECFAKSPRGRPGLVAANLECALRIMWQRWCQGLPAEAFEVTQQELADATREVAK